MEIKPKIRVGVVGVGHLGKYHLEKYAQLPDVELVGIADIQKDRLEPLSRQYRIRGYQDYRHLLSITDAVSIVVPTSLHAEVAQAFLRHNVDVLLEKPMTQSVAEAEELVALAETRQCLLQIGHLERFNPAFLEIKPFIQNPLFIESHRLSPFKFRGTDVDVILDLMIHDLDLILNLVPSAPQQVQAVGVPVVSPRVDIANVRIQFQNGAVANITASRISVKELRKMRIFQPAAYISLDFKAKSYSVVNLEPSGEGASLMPQFTAREGSKESGDALELELRSFIDSVKSREKPLVCGEEGKKALALAHWINEEIEKNFERAKPSAGAWGHLPGFPEATRV